MGLFCFSLVSHFSANGCTNGCTRGARSEWRLAPLRKEGFKVIATLHPHAALSDDVAPQLARRIGYARVSTDEQTLNAQKDALRAAGCVDVFEDIISGAVTARRGLDAALAALRAGDTLVVARLDRLGRSMPHLVATVHELHGRGVGFRSLAEAIDTTSAAGRLVLHIFASLADFERDLIRERTREALAAKKRRGERIGRPRALTPARIEAAREMLSSGHAASHVARVLQVGRSTLYRALGPVAARAVS